MFSRLTNRIKNAHFLQPALARHRVRRAFKSTHIEPTLVFTMAKVGSSAIGEILSRYFAPETIFHFHTHQTLDDDIRRKQMAGLRIPYMLHVSNELKNHLGDASTSANTRIKVVSGFRDPIARQVSNMFQQPALVNPRLIDQSGRIDENLAVEWANEKLNDIDYYQWPLEWFHMEFEPTTGINIFETPFNRRDGYIVLSKGRFRILVITQEAIRKNLGVALREAFDIDFHGDVPKSNARSETPESVTYQRVLARIRIERETLDYVCGSPTMKYFYDDQVLEEIRNKWTNGRQHANA